MVGFCVYRRSCLLWSPVVLIVALYKSTAHIAVARVGHRIEFYDKISEHRTSTDRNIGLRCIGIWPVVHGTRERVSRRQRVATWRLFPSRRANGYP